MHNRVPQMGYYHKGMGTYIYNDDRIPQMGSAQDILDAFVRSGTNIGKSKELQQDLLNLLNTGSLDLSNLEDLAPGSLLTELEKVPEIAALEAKGTAAAVQAKTNQLTKQFTDTFNAYKSQIMILGLLAVGGAAYWYFKRRK